MLAAGWLEQAPWLGRFAPIVMLVVSNLFMTYAWYGHLKDLKAAPLWMVVLVSWSVAFFEYCFQVPANRLGAVRYSFAELKTMQEVITLVVFAGFSVVYLKQALAWNHLVAAALLVAAAFFVFHKW